MAKELNTKQKALVALVAANPNSTLEQIGELFGEPVASGTMNALVANGNVKVGDKVMVERVALRPVSVYAVVAELPADIKMSDALKAFYADVSANPNLTLAELNAKLGTKYTSGAVNSLIVKGYVATDKVKKPGVVKKAVNSYFVG